MNLRNNSRIEKESVLTNMSNNCQIQIGINNNLQVEILICQKCFWCTSCFDMSNLMSLFLGSRCPICKSESSFDSIPVCSNEGYRYTLDDKKGVVLEFFLRNSKDEEIVRHDGEGGELLIK